MNDVRDTFHTSGFAVLIRTLSAQCERIANLTLYVLYNFYYVDQYARHTTQQLSITALGW